MGHSANGTVGDGRDGRIEFYIDGVHQVTIEHPVPDDAAEVVMGVRQMVWTGTLDFSGTQTMLIDWLDISPISVDFPNALADNYSTFSVDNLSMTAINGVLANDIGSGLTAVLINPTKHGVLSVAVDGSFTYKDTHTFDVARLTFRFCGDAGATSATTDC